MKVYIFILSCFVMINFSKAQTNSNNKEQLLARVIYKFTHVNDTSDRNIQIKAETITYLAKHAAYYSAYTGDIEDQLSKQVEDPAFDGNIVLNKSSNSTIESLYLNTLTRELKTKYIITGNDFLVEETYPEQKWTISNETKKIGNYDCQKAEATFRGRTYTAWFAAELPFPYGPWKLHGLPGLILEAYDSKNEVTFEYAGFDLMDEENMSIGIPIDTRIDKIEDVKKLQKANPNITPFNTTPIRINILEGTKKSKMANYPPEKIKSISIQNSPDYKNPNKTNNPIELTD